MYSIVCHLSAGSFRLRTVVLASFVLAGCGMPMPDGRGVMRVGDDLVGTRGEIVLRDSAAGDVIVAGGSIAFIGVAGADYLGAGGQQTISGRIGGALRAAGGQIVVHADVGRNATIAGGRVHLRRGGSIRGTAYLTGGSVAIDGHIGRHARIGAGDVVLRGDIDGDVVVTAGQLRIEDGAHIGGSLTYRVDEGGTTIDPGATIDGEITALPPRRRSRLPVLFRIIMLAGFLVAGTALILLAPGKTSAAADMLTLRPGLSIGMGVAWLIAVPLAAAGIALTLIGIPLALIACLAYLTSLFLARTVPALWLGRLLLRKRVRPGRRGDVLAFLAGGVMLVVMQLIPYVGVAIFVAATVLGLGAFAIALQRPA